MYDDNPNYRIFMGLSIIKKIGWFNDTILVYVHKLFYVSNDSAMISPGTSNGSANWQHTLLIIVFYVWQITLVTSIAKKINFPTHSLKTNMIRIFFCELFCAELLLNVLEFLFLIVSLLFDVWRNKAARSVKLQSFVL